MGTHITFIFFGFVILMFPSSLRAQIQPQIVTPHLFGSGSLPPPRIAEEDEIRQFFANYVDRYARRDIDGFLSFFSSRAVENQKEGIEEIRKIYTDFFNQSEELRYSMKGNMEFDQNTVEVNGRYQIDQLNKKGQRKVLTGSIRWVLIREEGALKILSLDYQSEKSP